MEKTLGIDWIEKILPQRYPFLFIDRVLEVDEQEERVVCVKNISINEYFFTGHFPSQPIVPGVIVIETIAQASIILYAVLKPRLIERGPEYYLGKVEVKFSKPVKAGDRLIIEVYNEKIIDTAGIVRASAKVNDETVTWGRISFGVKLKNV
ncbi:MAG: 3-hydroxyacyl-ACP dehydratase FabZ [Candidatus Omnitrophota bacterium]